MKAAGKDDEKPFTRILIAADQVTKSSLGQDEFVYVADVELHGPASNHELHLAVDDSDFLGVFPLKGDKVARLIGAVKPEAEQRRDLTWDDVSPKVLQRMRLDVRRVNWFSTYRVHHRVADRFRSGRGFLAGDAAHVHSPVGGQGMNTGIGDAVNLAWKLGEVLRGRAHLRLLDSYQPERMAFAQRLVATTDRAFTLVSRDGWVARTMRIHVVPRILPGLARRDAFRKLLFRTLSQTAVDYRRSPLSQGKAGKVRAGDRLPWVRSGSGSGSADREDNHVSLGALRWQIHIYGEVAADTMTTAKRWGVPVHEFVWSRAVALAGLARGAVYLVRPDGYVGLADRAARPDVLERYLESVFS